MVLGGGTGVSSTGGLGRLGVSVGTVMTGGFDRNRFLTQPPKRLKRPGAARAIVTVPPAPAATMVASVPVVAPTVARSPCKRSLASCTNGLSGMPVSGLKNPFTLKIIRGFWPHVPGPARHLF